MGLLLNLFENRASTVNPLHPRDPALVELFGGSRSIAGPQITESNALSISVVWACVQIIAETLASLPFFPYRRITDGREVATDHPLYRVLHQQTNNLGMTPMDFRQTLTAHILTWGNAFAEIIRNSAGAVTELYPLLPSRMRLQTFGGKLFYYVRADDGKELQLRADQILHLRGLGNDGMVGYSVISKHRETLGLTKAEEEYRARFFSNDARPGGVLQHPGRLSDEAYERLKKSWSDAHAGTENKHKPAILEENMQWKDVGIPPKDAEFIAGRTFQIQEVARIFRVPLVLLQEHEKSTSWGSGIEQFMLGFVVQTLRSWAVRWEQQCNIALLTESERQIYYLEHKFEALLRGDAKTQADSLSVMRQNGALNGDEWRQLLNMNPIPDGSGKIYWRPANMIPADAPFEIKPPAQ